MSIQDIEGVEREIVRFSARLASAKNRAHKDKFTFHGCKETGAVKRGAMDLKNELTKLTK